MAERRAIGAFLDGAVGVEDVMMRTARLLAHLTHQVAIVQFPSPTPAGLRHVELVRLSAARLLVIAIRSTGDVDQRVVECPMMTDDEVDELRDVLNGAAAGLTAALASTQLRTSLSGQPHHMQRRLSPVVDALCEMLGASTSERLAVGGVPNLARFGAEYNSIIEPLLEAIEEQVVLLRLLGEAAGDSGVVVRIGSEVPHEALREASVVASHYAAPDAAIPAGLGVVGPTRMDYPSTMAAVRAVASYVGRCLGAGGDDAR